MYINKVKPVFSNIMQVLHEIGPDKLLNLMLTFLSSADAKAILKNRILMSQKWAIHVSGISTGTSWCYFDFHEIYPS